MTFEHSIIDVSFDVRLDSRGKDPDFASPTLKKFHKTLWNKRLPNGEDLELFEGIDTHYLLGKTESRVISLSSDTMCNSYSKRKRMQLVVEPHKDAIENFRKCIYTVGGFILFPAKKVEGHNTINQERGWIKAIDDRFDLTLECIRLYYLGKDSPLFKVLSRYSDFFDLFVNFRGYVEFFLLQDLVSVDFQSIQFFRTDGLSVETKALPPTSEEYLEYMQNAQAFLIARNQRILNWVKMENAK